MAVRAEEGFAGLAEAFQMHLMANTVAGLGKINTMFSGYGLYVFMVISVLKACLKGIVVDICNGFFCFNARNADSFKLQIRHCTGGILRQRLVYFDGYFLSGGHFSADQMAFDEFFSDIQSHNFVPPCFFWEWVALSCVTRFPKGAVSAVSQRPPFPLC